MILAGLSLNYSKYERVYVDAICFSTRSCVVAKDQLFVIGGQEGDFMAKPGSPIFKCSRRHEVWREIYISNRYFLNFFCLWPSILPWLPL